MHYNTADIRQFLVEYFTDEELSVLCYDYFRLVYDAFTTGMTKGLKIQLLIEYCERREIVPNLLAAIQDVRPEQYKRRFSEVTVRPGAPTERNPRQVFISHAHQDADFAHRLAGDLKKRGWRVWIAPDSIRPGERWVKAINRGLEESGVFILALTPAAVSSHWVEDETNAAIELKHRGHLRFIPLDVEPCHMPPLWSAYQRVPFRRGYEAGLAALLRELEGKKAAPTPPSYQEPAEVAPTLPGLAKRLEKLPRSWLMVGGGLALLCLIVVLVVISGGVNPPSLTPTTPIPVARLTSTATNAPAPPAPMPTATLIHTSVPSTPTPTPVPCATRVSEKDGMVMIYVPAGEFLMGSSDAEIDAAFKPCEQDYGSGLCRREWFENESPQHTVDLDAFWIDRTEVTNAQYSKCVKAGECDTSSYADDSRYNGEDQPVQGVSWHNAKEYCEWAGAVLPTEAQWEYAARGVEGFIYPWGNEFDCSRGNFDDEKEVDDYVVPKGKGCDGYVRTSPVGRFPSGASWCGVQDMVGNVWEWVADWYADYPSEVQMNPIGPEDGSSKVLRGGSWLYFSPISLRAASRNGDSPDSRSNDVGFRCARSPGQ